MVLKGSVIFGPRGSTALGFGGHAHRAFPAYKTLMIRARVSSQLKESAAEEMAETSGGTNRIFDNIKISFTPDAE